MRRCSCVTILCVFFFQAEDGIRDIGVTGVQTCALPIFLSGALERLTLATPGAFNKNAAGTTTFLPLVTTSDQAMLVNADKIQDYQQNLEIGRASCRERV